MEPHASETLKLGIVGLDTSHVVAFTELLHDSHHPHHLPGARVVAAYPGGSADFALSRDRVPEFTRTLQDVYGVAVVDDVGRLCEQVDAVLLESVDGRVHARQFEQIAPHGKPVFIDKPLALTRQDADTIAMQAAHFGTPVFSSSALRFSEALVGALADDRLGRVVGCDAFGPLSLEPTQPGLFWYGIHLAEVLFTVLGPQWQDVQSMLVSAQDEIAAARWQDGRYGTLRGNRRGNAHFTAVVHRERGTQFVDISGCTKPFYASLLEAILAFVRTRVAPVPVADTCAIISWLETANALREDAQHAVSGSPRPRTTNK
ncbi:MAG: Gfo/Idh/MocA family oxidoreductase [Firmicutes bacterium]|nr:Gfo/Idh/MocA family oxidoreductase [Bacillota bacterium]